MNFEPDDSRFTPLPADSFALWIDGFDYRREGWSDCILYIDKVTDQIIAYLDNAGRYRALASAVPRAEGERQ